MTVNVEWLLVLDAELHKLRPLVCVPQSLLQTVDFDPTLLLRIALFLAVTLSPDFSFIIGILEEIDRVFVERSSKFVQFDHLLVPPTSKTASEIRNPVFQLAVRLLSVRKPDFAWMYFDLIDLKTNWFGLVVGKNGR